MRKEINKKERIHKLIYILFAYFALIALHLHYHIQTSVLMAIPLFFGLVYFYIKQSILSLVHKEKREILTMLVLAILFSVFTILGNHEAYSHNSKSFISFLSLLSSWAWCFLFWNLLVFLYHCLKRIDTKRSMNRPYKFLYMCLVGVLFVFWLPYLLNYFPGVTTWDVEYQLTQILGVTQMTKAHPIVHTLFIKFFYNAALSLFGNANLALATVTVVQMLILSAIYSYVIYYLYRKNYPRVMWIGTLVFYGLLSVNAAHTVNLWKDILFSAVFLVFTFILWTAKDVDFNDNKAAGLYFLRLAIVSILLSLMRNTGIYIFFCMVPFMLYCYRKKLPLIIAMIALTLVSQYSVEHILHERYQVQDGNTNDIIESLSIPIQQVSRVIVEKGFIDPQSEAELKELVSFDEIDKRYEPRLSDPVKAYIRSTGIADLISEKPFDYLLVWLKIGINNPAIYLKAYIDQTKGYWYPDLQGPVLRMESAGKEESLDTYQVHLLGEKFSHLMYRSSFAYLDLPILGVFYSIAAYVWLVFTALAMLFINRDRILPILPALVLWGTLMLSTPVADEFRYIYPIVLAAPVYVAMLYDSFTKKNGSLTA